MAEIAFIVEKLNSEPFRKNFTLVTFDEKASDPKGLLQLLNDVLIELDSKAHRVNLSEEPPDITGARVAGFLQLLKYPLPPDVIAFQNAIAKSDKPTIYSILTFLLGKLPALKKRAYVGRYLLPIEVPPEFLANESLAETLAQYRALQAEFKEGHKAYERSLQAMTGPNGQPKRPPAELRKEISQLEDERRQLVEKIAGLKKRNADAPGFAALLEATSNLRKAQEEEGRLAERMHEQRLALQNAERKYQEVNRKLAETRASTREDLSSEQLLEAARKEAEESRRLATKVLPASLEARKETLARLSKILAEPVKSEEDVYALRSQVATLEDTVNRLTQEVANSQKAAGEDKLALFRTQSAIIAKKLLQREEAFEVAQREHEALAREIEAKEAKLSEVSGGSRGYMRRDEFNAYAANLRQKTQQFKALKQELADIRQETVILSRTEAITKSRAGDLEAFLKKVEEKSGVSGYTAVASEMEKISALKQRIDESKGKTLDEISRIVDDINSLVMEKKAKLAPIIKELRAVRAEHSEVEGGFLHEKAVYDNTAAGLAAERATLEREASAVQDEALREESRFHSLQLSMDLLSLQIERAQEEASYERGEGRYMRDFRTVKDLYSQKLGQLEVLAKELRKKQKDLKENAGTHALQRQRFLELKRLLNAKAAIYKKDPTGGLNLAVGGVGGGPDILEGFGGLGGVGVGVGGGGGGMMAMMAGAGGAGGGGGGSGFEVLTLDH